VIAVNNVPEFAGIAMDEWTYRRGIELDFMRTGKQIENALCREFCWQVLKNGLF
jgi:hypothetical protein